ncbi:MAG TPA: SLC13 family permease [Natrialbaceae archaeon]|nr:SLC13 family permease [Natrialbaceae archaeon]
MPPVTPEILFVFALVALALVLFATEPVPVDVTAIGLLVTLLLVDPVTAELAEAGLLASGLDVLADPTADGLAGFASTATLTVLAMFILSRGVRETGIIQRLGHRIAALTGDDETRQLGATIGLVAPISGFINNTAAVAILLPMVTDLAHRGRTSPSKLLMPLSFASMFGGTLTLIGTSTNILAAAVATDLDPAVGARFTMFVFAPVGILISVIGVAYFMTIGRRLLPERIKAEEDLTAEFQMADYLTEVVVREDSPLVDRTVEAGLSETDFDVDLLQLVRNGEVFLEPLGPKSIRAGDVFVVRTDRDTLVELLDVEGLDLVPDVQVDEAELETASEQQNLVEVVVGPGASLVGQSLRSVAFRQRYDATVLAIRRGPELVRKRLDDVGLRVGDTLLIQATAESVERLDANPDFIVAQEIERTDYRESKVWIAVGIVAAVVGVAAFTSVPIVASALAGALAMILTGCLRPTEVYESVQWDVIFLLAGVIPLGTALQHTGAAELVADGLVASSGMLPPIAVLGLLYVVTALLTNVVSNNASVVLMVPVAFQAAATLDANVFSFVLAVTFAASTAFMTPVGYQTNLFVYGPGGYTFMDYVRVGAPLQLLVAIVTTVGIWGLFGV